MDPLEGNRKKKLHELVPWDRERKLCLWWWFVHRDRQRHCWLVSSSPFKWNSPQTWSILQNHWLWGSFSVLMWSRIESNFLFQMLRKASHEHEGYIWCLGLAVRPGYRVESPSFSEGRSPSLRHCWWKASWYHKTRLWNQRIGTFLWAFFFFDESIG